MFYFQGVKVKSVFQILATLIPIAPLVAWATYKPGRVMVPEWVGEVSCVTSKICLDEVSKFQEASNLYESASHFVGNVVGPFQKEPRIIFCSTQDCAQSFGLKATANTVGRLGIVIGPKGWLDYYVRHEMLHHRQVEELGTISHLLDPRWFIEGMAYSLSNDPRRPLSDPWQRYRTEFEAWIQKVGKEKLWEEARRI